MDFRFFQTKMSDSDSVDDALAVTDGMEQENVEMMLAEGERRVRTKKRSIEN